VRIDGVAPVRAVAWRAILRASFPEQRLKLSTVFGAYAAFWFVAAGRIEDGVGQFAQSLRAHNLDLSWRSVRVGGVSLGMRGELSEARPGARAIDGSDPSQGGTERSNGRE